MNKSRFGLRDVILLALIGIIFGVIYFAGDFVYNAVTLALTPIGLGAGRQRLYNGPVVHGRTISRFHAQAPGIRLFGRISRGGRGNVFRRPMGGFEPDFRGGPRGCF